MKFWSQVNNVKNTEDKNLMNNELNKLEKRLFSNKNIGINKSLYLIIKGIAFIFILTAFEYALRVPDISNNLKTIFTTGYFLSVLGVLQLPYGIYQLIKSLFKSI